MKEIALLGAGLVLGYLYCKEKMSKAEEAKLVPCTHCGGTGKVPKQ